MNMFFKDTYMSRKIVETGWARETRQIKTNKHKTNKNRDIHKTNDKQLTTNSGC